MMQNSRFKQKIAITGGYASGKSTVTKRIAELGFQTYSADAIYNEMLFQKAVVDRVCEITFTSPIIDCGKYTIDKKKVAEVVFNDKKILNELNIYTHKIIYDRINELFDNYCENKPVFFEIPLLFEDNKQNDFDKVIVVLRSLNARIDSAICRDGVDKHQAEKRIQNQYNYDNLNTIEHTVIYNDKGILELNNRVDEIIEKFKTENKFCS